MTAEQRALLDTFSAWEREHRVDFEDLLDALSESFAEQADAEQDVNVRACLSTVAERLSAAALAFYASTK